MIWDSSYCFLYKAMTPSLLAAERWPGQTPEGVPALCADQSFGLDFWLPFYQEKGRRTIIIVWTLIISGIAEIQFIANS